MTTVATIDLARTCARCGSSGGYEEREFIERARRAGVDLREPDAHRLHPKCAMRTKKEYDAAAPAGRKVKTVDELTFEKVWREAEDAGHVAAEQCIPRPMHIKGYAPIDDGACGFAWVVVRPASHPFARWTRKHKGSRKLTTGGEEVRYVTEFNQSHERKRAFARAFANVLNTYGIPANAYDRLD